MRCAGALFAILVMGLPISCGRRGGSEQASEGYWWPEEPLTRSEKRQEIEIKIGRVRKFLDNEHIAGFLVGKSENFAWVTAGAENRGKAFVFLRDDDKRFLISNTGQLQQLMAEDLRDFGFEARAVPWYSGDDYLQNALSVAMDLNGGRPLGSDLPFRGARMVDTALTALRSPLTATEIRKYRWLGKACADALSRACFRIQQSMTERGIEALIASALIRHTIHPVEIQVASNDRVSRFPDAPPSDTAKLEGLVRIRIRATRWGLHVGLTRLVSFGPVPLAMQQNLEAAALVCAGFWARTQPGATAGALLQGAIADYAAAGFPDEWKASDPGGAIGYGGWDWIARPGSQQKLQDGQTFAWKSGIHGVGLEDTILVIGENLEVLTEAPGWPVVEARALGRVYRLPAILIR